MFTVKSILRCWAPAWLLFICACWGQSSDKPIEIPDLDLGRLQLEQKEVLLGQLVDDMVQQNGSSVYNMTLLNRYERSIKTTLGSLEAARVLEIGPGRNLALGVTMVLRGARRYSAVDIYQHPDLYEPGSYQNMHLLARYAGGASYNIDKFDDVVRIEGGKVHLDPDRIEWLYPHESYDFPMADSAVDFVFSHSGFEHFNEPERTIERIFQVLRPGGATAHSIDLRDHDDFSEPYAFLKLGAEEWRARFTEQNLHNFTNRWRAVDFRQAFETAGFEIVEDRRKAASQVTETIKQTFHGDFQRYSLADLSTTSLWIVARKPDPETVAEQSAPTPSR